MEDHKTDRIEEEKVDLFRLLQEFGKVFHRLFWFPLALAILCGVFLGVRQWRTYVPMYESSVTFAVRLVSSSLTDVAGSTGYYDKAAAEQLSKTFPHLLQSELMQNRLQAAMGTDRLGGTVSAQTVDNTNMFTLRVTSTDPQTAYRILNAVIEVYPDVAEYVIGQTGLTLLTEPSVASAPYNAFRPVRTMAKGACVGLAAGLVLLLLYSLTRKTIRDPEDVQTLLSQKCIAALPLVRFKRREKDTEPTVSILDKQISDSFRESIRDLRIKLLREMEKENQKVLLVTSTMPGEGKSTVAVNLALSLSQNGAKVIFVDLDLRKPSAKRILGVKAESLGVSELLAKKNEDPVSHLLQVGNSGLYLLAGDKPSGNAYKALHSARLISLIEALRNQADYVTLEKQT
ncbi:MAG: formate--tetrahydrofolate ligase, partial [Clostridia bacterium]|nr:formate--tetrahydrofolate ligase [Clostridia bacterium]